MDISNGKLGYSLTLDNVSFKRDLRESMNGVQSFSAQTMNQIAGIDVAMNNLMKGATAFLQLI